MRMEDTVTYISFDMNLGSAVDMLLSHGKYPF